MRRIITGAIFLVAFTVAAPARAADFVWSFTSGGLGASAVFHDLGGGMLQITLTNTGTGDVFAPTEVLTALQFSCNCGSLAPVSATTNGPVVNTGAQVYASGLNVGGEFGLGTTTEGFAPASGGYAITSMGGFNGIGQPNFGGPELQGPPSNALDGLQYGIVPSTENGVGNGDVSGSDLIQHEVVFVLSGFNGNMNFTNLGFQYGTSVGANSFSGGSSGGSQQTLVPEPTSLLLFGSGLAMTAYRTRRKKPPKSN